MNTRKTFFYETDKRQERTNNRNASIPVFMTHAYVGYSFQTITTHPLGFVERHQKNCRCNTKTRRIYGPDLNARTIWNRPNKTRYLLFIISSSTRHFLGSPLLKKIEGFLARNAFIFLKVIYGKD